MPKGQACLSSREVCMGISSYVRPCSIPTMRSVTIGLSRPVTISTASTSTCRKSTIN